MSCSGIRGNGVAFRKAAHRRRHLSRDFRVTMCGGTEPREGTSHIGEWGVTRYACAVGVIRRSRSQVMKALGRHAEKCGLLLMVGIL